MNRGGLQRGQDRLGAGDADAPAFLDVEQLDGTVVDDCGVAPGALPHTETGSVELEAEGTGEVTIAVGEHEDVVAGAPRLPTGARLPAKISSVFKVRTSSGVRVERVAGGILLLAEMGIDSILRDREAEEPTKSSEARAQALLDPPVGGLRVPGAPSQPSQ